ncbi:MAG: hypothetical protein AB7H97_14405 [Pseudobdellovibrionaceae bacterium]
MNRLTFSIFCFTAILSAPAAYPGQSVDKSRANFVTAGDLGPLRCRVGKMVTKPLSVKLASEFKACAEDKTSCASYEKVQYAQWIPTMLNANSCAHEGSEISVINGKLNAKLIACREGKDVMRYSVSNANCEVRQSSDLKYTVHLCSIQVKYYIEVYAVLIPNDFPTKEKPIFMDGLVPSDEFINVNELDCTELSS